SAIEGRKQKLAVSLPDEAVHLDGDALRLEQVFVNLLSNSSKFTREGGQVRLTMEKDDEAGQGVVRVQDNGSGIAPELLPRIFDLFTQADRSLAHADGGLGIGLTLVKRLVELHGGSVEAASAGVGRGSEFVVRLPVLAEPVPLPPAEKTPARPVVPRRILIVDDSADAAESLAILLDMSGHDVNVAHSGPAALEVAAAHKPEGCVLDIGLPGMDGYQVARKLRKQPGMKEALLVALTGYGQDEDRRLAQEAGFDYHLTKPADLQAMNELLTRGPSADG